MTRLDFILFVLFLFSYSCTNSDVRKIQLKNVITIHVNPNEINELFPWEEFIDSFSIVPLETAKESVFSGIHKFVYNDKKLFLFDLQLQEIFIYREDGSFIRKLHMRGKGPGQYNVIKDFHFDNKNNLVILDYRRIHKYDSTLAYLHSIYNEEYGEAISLCYFDDQHYYTFNLPIETLRNNYLIKQKKGNRDIQFIENRLSVASRERFIRHKDDFYMIPPYYQDCIYQVTQDSIYIRYKIDFNGQFIPVNDLVDKKADSEREIDEMKRKGFVYKIGKFYELSNFIYFEYVIKGLIHSAVYNKNTEIVVSARKCLLHNELPIAILGHSETENCLFAALEPYTMINKRISNELLSAYPDLMLLNQLKETQNPVLFKLYLK